MRALFLCGGAALLILTAAAVPVRGQFLSGGARAAALGNASTALPNDDWGAGNPAGWATVDSRTVSFFASQAFGLTELRYGALHAVVPSRIGSISLGASTFGFDDFRETHLDAGFARGLQFGSTRRFYVGAALRYYHVSIGRYGSGSAFGLTAGWQVTVWPSVMVGFSAVNLNQPGIAGNEEFERSLSIGISHQPDSRFLVLLDLIKDIRFPASVRMGMELRPVPVIALRAGATTSPTRFTAGFGIRLDWLSMDIAAEHHEILGWSPALSLSAFWD